MPLNLELKARAIDLGASERVAQSLRARFSGEMHQVDTYFSVPKGRLKLRQIDRDKSELIFYERPEDSGQRLSRYEIFQCGDGSQLNRLLSAVLGRKAVVDKRRRVFLHGANRIHLDDVVNLGTFLEFECPVGETEQDARRSIQELMEAFGVGESDAIAASYSDLILSEMRK